MSYSIYVGEPTDMLNCKEIGIFSEAEHTQLFLTITNIGAKNRWLYEMQTYHEFINFTNVEVVELMKEVRQLIKHEALQTNALLNCLILAGEEAILRGLQIMCVGENE